MKLLVITDEWSIPAINEFAGLLTDTIDICTYSIKDATVTDVTERHKVHIGRHGIDIENIGQYDLAVARYDSAGIFTQALCPLDTEDPYEHRISLYINSILQWIRDTINSCNPDGILVLMEPATALRRTIISIANELGKPVVSLSTSPFGGLICLDMGYPLQTGFLSHPDHWRRIQRVTYTETEELKYKTWKDCFITNQVTRGTGLATDNEENEVELPDHYILLVGQVPCDANQFLHSLDISYQPAVVARALKALFPHTDIIFKEHSQAWEHPRGPETPDPEDAISLGKHANIHKFIAKADHIITWNSNAGLEALVYNKPVTLLGQTFYRGKGISNDINTLEGIDKTMYLFQKYRDRSLPEKMLKFMICRYLVHKCDSQELELRVRSIVNRTTDYGI